MLRSPLPVRDNSRRDFSSTVGVFFNSGLMVRSRSGEYSPDIKTPRGPQKLLLYCKVWSGCSVVFNAGNTVFCCE